MVRPVLLLLALPILLAACGKPAAIKTIASKTGSVTLPKVGTLTLRLEMRELEGQKLAVGLFSYAGEETVTLESQVSLYRFDTNKTNALERIEDSFDLASGSTKTISTKTVGETRRSCASVTVRANAFDPDGNEIIKNAVFDVCERN